VEQGAKSIEQEDKIQQTEDRRQKTVGSKQKAEKETEEKKLIAESPVADPVSDPEQCRREPGRRE
jgi:hypothetical protein